MSTNSFAHVSHRGRPLGEPVATRVARVAPDLAGLLGRYFRYVPPEEVAERDPVDLVGAVRSHRRLAANRVAGRACVDVFNPTRASDGWSSPATVVHIVMDDMPYLVDAVSAELARGGAEVRHLVHPVVVVRRDLTGNLREILPEVDPGESLTGTLVESWMHIEIDPVTNPVRIRALERNLRRVLGDVRDVVEDAERMVATTRRVAHRLATAGPPRPPGGAVEAADAAHTANLLRWLTEGHFTFLGYRRYELARGGAAGEEPMLRGVLSSGLGVLRWDSFAAHRLPGPDDAFRHSAPPLFVLSPAGRPSPLHRSVYPCNFSVTTFDERGDIDGQHRWLGVFTPAALRENVLEIPVIGRRVRHVLQRAGFPPESHSGQQMLEVIQDYPRTELFSTDADSLYATATGVLAMGERRQLRLFLRRDPHGFFSCLVYLQKDRFTAASLRAMRDVLLTELHGEDVEHSAHVGESTLARVHFLVCTDPKRTIEAPDVARVQERLVDAVSSWDDRMVEAVAEQQAEGEQQAEASSGGARTPVGVESAAELGRLYSAAFPGAYKEAFRAIDGLADMQRLLSLTDMRQVATSLYVPPGVPADGESGELRFKLYLAGQRVVLSQVLPVLLQMGVEVIDERQYEVERPDGIRCWVADFGLGTEPGAVAGPSPGLAGEEFRTISARFQDTFEAAWRGDAEIDWFNALVLRAGLDWRQAAVLRTYAKYLRQAETHYSQRYIEEVLVDNSPVASALVLLFETRFRPSPPDEDRDSAETIVAQITKMIDDVASLDADLILRAYLTLIQATLRTNYFTRNEAGAPRQYLALKLDPSQIPQLPQPRPKAEIFVCSPRVEGVHLRFGLVARGGLRWSDRKEDYRAEILGLARAQTAKNALIVPDGAKGGFVVKRPPASTGDPDADRVSLQHEAVTCYRMFISGLLDLTDNRTSDGGLNVVTPADVTRHDGDDTYLVVAADKGTSTFSDLANEIAGAYGFWLGDAFASGGSAGYDHKAMGITARGAWESVRRHFRELGVDTQNTDFTVVGIGDMSGDVFGNGMLLSPHIRLVAAFDHRHVFVDPTPDAAISYAERKRLFSLPRSSWADYDRDAISEGGGVWPRSAKSVPVSPQLRTALDLPDSMSRVSPADLIKAILRAPVDLLWNGGIGTYVKASTETQDEISDRTSDALRVDAADLRVKVITEGGNLGVTQRGRIEFARKNGKINTDGIDNSAGVDCSDHEVNIKIVLDQLVADGRLDRQKRNRVLARMTDEVAQLVLADNHRQNVVLGVGRAHAAAMFPVHTRLIAALENSGRLDRKLESLPTAAQCKALATAGEGLTSPELATLLAHVKRKLKDEVLASELPDLAAFAPRLHDYFPTTLRERFGDALAAHPLRREIVATVLVNEVVDRGGVSYAFRLAEELGTSDVDAVRAFAVVTAIFDLRSLWAEISALDTVVATSAADTMMLESRRLLDRASRWLLSNRPQPLAVGAETRRFAPVIAELAPMTMSLLRGRQRDSAYEHAERLAGLGVPLGLAQRVATLLPAFALLDIVEATELAERDIGEPGPESGDREIAELYFALADYLDIEHVLNSVTALERGDRWHALARLSLRDDVYSSMRAITLDVERDSDPGNSPDEKIGRWVTVNSSRLDRAQPTLRRISHVDQPDLAMLSVATRQIRGMIR